ncbi:MAG TPA: D-hexose-6-phosphate mutarotase [Tepidisphaeraceae bacterium]|jgi:D-hexose-6-phosphate mutarotase
MSEYVNALSDHVVEHGAIPRLVIRHPMAEAELFIQGAHLTRWKPKDEPAVIFVSPLAKFVHGVGIRGGIPVCFPWFANHATDATLPAHGFARTTPWALVSQASSDSGVELDFRLVSSEQTRAIWPHDFACDLHVAVGRTLEMRMVVANTDRVAFSFEEALHTYYSVSDVRQVTVSGLTGGDYLDKPDGLQRKTESEPAVRFTGETDRVYLNTTATCVIDDPGERRRIVVEKEGSRSTVVWNPAAKRASQLNDLGEANWPPFVCVETANVGENSVKLQPGETHAMTMRVRVERD